MSQENESCEQISGHLRGHVVKDIRGKASGGETGG